jgi:hypothetical protein
MSLDALIISSKSSQNVIGSTKSSLVNYGSNNAQEKTSFQVHRIKDLHSTISKKLSQKLKALCIEESMETEKESQKKNSKDSVNGKRRRSSMDDFFEGEYINNALLQAKIEGDIFDTSKILTNGKDILSKLQNIRFDIIKESDTQPIIKKLKVPREVPYKPPLVIF